MTSDRVIIAAKYRGPPESANGGYTAGILAQLIEGPCSVMLRAPPPLDRPLRLSRAENGIASLHDADTLLADAHATPIDLVRPAAVSFEEAQRATLHYPGPHPHPYPECFVCGPERPRGDGLAVYAGPVEDRRIVASPWLPSRELCTDGDVVDAPFGWAALDCPSWFGFSMFEDVVPLVLLGRLAVDVQRRPKCDERCVIMGWNIGREGRRIECGSMLLDAEHGECLAYARSTWVTLKLPVADP